jgi:mRNA-degrading endonuclease toxin of MazEF toxin-antitoxin module
MVINRFEVYLANLDPTVGSEIKKSRPCLVVSPDEMNHHIRTHNRRLARATVGCENRRRVW